MWWITLLQSGRLDVEIKFKEKKWIMRFSIRDVNPGESWVQMEQNPCVPFLRECCECYGGSRWSVARLSQSTEGLMGSEKESRLATQVYKKCIKDWKVRGWRGWGGQRMYRGACVTDQWSVEKRSRGKKVLTNKWIIAGFQVWNVSVRQK